MDTWTRIERGGFYPKAVQRALRRALGAAEPLATLCQVDTGFDRGSVFRHLTVASLTDRAIVQLHVDEMDGGSATIATAVHRVGDIAGGRRRSGRPRRGPGLRRSPRSSDGDPQ